MGVVRAGAHFSLQRFLPLVLLGMIFGTLLVRTRNLAALRAAAQPVERLHLLAAHLPGRNGRVKAMVAAMPYAPWEHPQTPFSLERAAWFGTNGKFYIHHERVLLLASCRKMS